MVDLAERLLGEADLRIYSAEAWAKYTGATNYDQDLHRDYLNHTVLVPTTAQHHQQLEMFVFLSNVPEELGPPHTVGCIGGVNIRCSASRKYRRLSGTTTEFARFLTGCPRFVDDLDERGCVERRPRHRA